MSEIKTYTYGLKDVPTMAQNLASLLASHRIVTLTGPLGAGKTTLVREVLRTCGIQEPVTSPTFTYMNAYKDQRGQTFYHFDLYRIDSVEAFCSAGFDEYLYAPNSRALIEWPEVIMPLLDRSVCHATIEYDEDERKRMLRIACIE